MLGVTSLLVIPLIHLIGDGMVWYGMVMGECIAFGSAHSACCITCNITRACILQSLKLCSCSGIFLCLSMFS